MSKLGEDKLWRRVGLVSGGLALVEALVFFSMADLEWVNPTQAFWIQGAAFGVCCIGLAYWWCVFHEGAVE